MSVVVVSPCPARQQHTTRSDCLGRLLREGRGGRVASPPRVAKLFLTQATSPPVSPVSAPIMSVTLQPELADLR
jgi:hypothetical protein